MEPWLKCKICFLKDIMVKEMIVRKVLQVVLCTSDFAPFSKIWAMAVFKKTKTNKNQQVKYWVIQQGGQEAFTLKIKVSLLPT